MDFRRILSQIALVTGAFMFSIGLQAFAEFTQPTTSILNAGVFAPLNTGIAGQAKSGGLILNTGEAVNGLIVDNGNVVIGDNYSGGILSVQGATSTSLSMFNQTGSGDIAAFKASGETVFSIGTDGLCWNGKCKESWDDLTSIGNANVGAFMVKSSDTSSFKTVATNDFSAEGDVTFSNDSGSLYKSLYGHHYYDNLTIPEGVIVKVPAGKGGLALIVRKDLILRGDINADGAAIGGNGHEAGGGSTSSGYECHWNGSWDECGETSYSYKGQPAVFDGATIVAGVNYAKPAQTPVSYIWNSRYSLIGGASGSSGVGGGDILIIANNITFKSTAKISAKGTKYAGGGNVIIQANTVVDEGATFTLANPSGGADGQIIIASSLYSQKYIDTSGLDLANKTQTFTPGLNSLGTKHSFTVPSGVTQITVEAWGAGGGGGAGSETSCVNCYPAYGGGGGGGAYVPPQTITVKPGQVIDAIPGNGGKGMSGIYAGPGGDGENTVFGNSLVVAGGHGGTSARDWGASGSGGSGGVTAILGGMNGTRGSTPTGGNSGNGGNGGGTHSNGAIPGGGGGGGYLYRTGLNSGGVGGPGRIIVRW